MWRYYFIEECSSYGINCDTAYRIITCESTWNYRAANKTSSAFGLGQFLIGTWISTEHRMGTILYRDNPYDQINAFLWLAREDSFSHWECW